jgi:hypothetical protein
VNESNFFLSVAISSVDSEPIGLLIWATIGGVFVFFGLIFEKLAEWMNERFSGGWNAHKKLEDFGWVVLMLGIAIEISDAGFAANEGWQTRQMAIKSDPNNQPIAFVSAQAILIQEGTKRRAVDPLRMGACNIRIGTSDETNFWISGGMIWNLKCSSSQTIDRDDPNGKNTEWILDFKQDLMVPQFNGLVKDSTKWDTMKLDAAFLPDDVLILGGTLRLTVNSTKRDITIPLQKIRTSADFENFAKSPPKTVTVFTW